MRDVSKDTIIEIAVEAQEVLPDPHDHEILNLVEDCIGRELNDFEERLVIVAYENDAETAKRSIWYA